MPFIHTPNCMLSETSYGHHMRDGAKLEKKQAEASLVRGIIRHHVYTHNGQLRTSWHKRPLCRSTMEADAFPRQPGLNALLHVS